MVIDSVLTPWFVFCRLLPSLHLALAISPLLSVISSLVTAASLLGWLSTGSGSSLLMVFEGIFLQLLGLSQTEDLWCSKKSSFGVMGTWGTFLFGCCWHPSFLLSEPQFPHLWNGDGNDPNFIELWGLSKVISAKCLAQNWRHSRHSIHLSSMKTVKRHLWTRRGPSLNTKSAGALISDFLVSRTVRDKLALYIS